MRRSLESAVGTLRPDMLQAHRDRFSPKSLSYFTTLALLNALGVLCAFSRHHLCHSSVESWYTPNQGLSLFPRRSGIPESHMTQVALPRSHVVLQIIVLQRCTPRLKAHFGLESTETPMRPQAVRESTLIYFRLYSFPAQIYLKRRTIGFSSDFFFSSFLFFSSLILQEPGFDAVFTLANTVPHHLITLYVSVEFVYSSQISRPSSYIFDNSSSRGTVSMARQGWAYF